MDVTPALLKLLLPVYAAEEFETLAPAPPPILPDRSPVAQFGGYAKPAPSPVHTFSKMRLAAAASQDVAVTPQYDTTHVCVAPEEFDRFVASQIATFGGTTSKQGVFTVTPAPSSTMPQLVLTPAGTLSVFGFKTPIPYPFGFERTDIS